MKIKRMYLLTLLAMGLILANGCFLLLLGVGAGTGAATVAYVKGELKSTEEVSLDRAWGATLHALEDMGYGVTDREKGEMQARLVARHPTAAAKDDITIRFERKTPRVTEISIRVGMFGDEARSKMILNRIRRHY